MKKKGNKKMPTPRYKLIHNPIPTSLFCFKISFVCCECIRQRKKHLHIELTIYMKYIIDLKEAKM